MEQRWSFIGIGAGPSNLSLAALLEDKETKDYVFLDRKPQFSWHSESLPRQGLLQTNPLKDLVTPAEPTNRFSFLNYLYSNGILYNYFNRQRFALTRAQFTEYLKWVAENLTSVRFGVQVESIGYDDGSFLLRTNRGVYRGRDLVLGTGVVPYVPPCVTSELDHTIYHASTYDRYCEGLRNRDVVVVGAGQSGAEAFYDIITSRQPASVTWVTKCCRLAVLDDSCFANDFYTPAFVRQMHGLSKDSRTGLLEKILDTSDGITQALADTLYNALFDMKHFSSSPIPFEVRLNTRVVDHRRRGGRHVLSLHDQLTDSVFERHADVVILATGYRSGCYDLLSGLMKKHPELDPERVGIDFELKWRHSATNRIFIQNGATATHGLADKNYSLLAWRSSVIANRLIGQPVFKATCEDPIVTFSGDERAYEQQRVCTDRQSASASKGEY